MKSNLVKVETERQLADLAALQRMLEVSAGTFSLSIAVCSDRSLRTDLIADLKKANQGILLITVPPQTTDVLSLVRQADCSKASALFLLDLEESLPYGTDDQPLLRHLNSTRELWEQLRCPIVFWLAEYAAALMATLAPDFWRYRSHQFEFVSEQWSSLLDFRGSEVDFLEVVELPHTAKRFRMAELEQRLNQAGINPGLDLIPHVIGWRRELAYLYKNFKFPE